MELVEVDNCKILWSSQTVIKHLSSISLNVNHSSRFLLKTLLTLKTFISEFPYGLWSKFYCRFSMILQREKWNKLQA